MKMGCSSEKEITQYSPVLFYIVGSVSLCCSLCEELKGVNFADVSCNYANFTADVTFHDMFRGIVFPEGRYFNPDCKFSAPDIGTKNISFVLPLTDCGNLIREVDGDVYVSNNIVVQKHPIVQTDSDVVYKTSCKLPRQNITQMQVFTHESHPVHAWSNKLEAYMDFQFEDGLPGFDISNKLLVGDEFTIVIHVKDGGINNDFEVETCWAYEGKTITESQYVLKIYDASTCQSDWISGFNISEDVKNVSNTLVYGTLKAFKFPLSRTLHITCSVQACTESCYRHCDSNPGRSNYLKRSKRFSSEISDKSLRERHRLMKATIKALGIKLMERNRKLAENDSNFKRRSANTERSSLREEDIEVHTVTSTEIINNEIYNFNVTNNVVVYSSRDFDMKREYCNSSRIIQPECVPKLKFGIVTASLSFAIFCLIFICIGFILHIRKEKKKNHIDGFLLYNLY